MKLKCRELFYQILDVQSRLIDRKQGAVLVKGLHQHLPPPLQVQAKVEFKQLELGYGKYFNLHIGKQTKDVCPLLKVLGKERLTSDREKYLGDILTTDGRINRKSKGDH